MGYVTFWRFYTNKSPRMAKHRRFWGFPFARESSRNRFWPMFDPYGNFYSEKRGRFQAPQVAFPSNEKIFHSAIFVLSRFDHVPCHSANVLKQWWLFAVFLCFCVSFFDHRVVWWRIENLLITIFFSLMRMPIHTVKARRNEYSYNNK